MLVTRFWLTFVSTLVIVTAILTLLGLHFFVNRTRMGMAIRGPWYEFNTNPEFPNASNQAYLDEMGATLERAGVPPNIVGAPVCRFQPSHSRTNQRRPASIAASDTSPSAWLR